MKITSNTDYKKAVETIEKANKVIEEQELKLEFLRLENKSLIDFKIELIDFLRERFRIYNCNYFNEVNKKRSNEWLVSSETIKEVLNKILPDSF